MTRLPVLAVLILLAACGGNKGSDNSGAPLRESLGKSANPEAFNRSFGKLLNSYLLLKEAFVTEKADTAINRIAQDMETAADSLVLSELSPDSTLATTAGSYSESIAAELKGLAGEKDMEAKKKSFQMVSDQLYDLAKLVRYDRAVLYHQYCPMAFNDQGAYWLSGSPEIRNPYIPSQMLTCGETKDSIDFRLKP